MDTHVKNSHVVIILVVLFLLIALGGAYLFFAKTTPIQIIKSTVHPDDVITLSPEEAAKKTRTLNNPAFDARVNLKK